MDVRELAGLDLNLLVQLHVLLDERHVTRAAERLGVSQPALSRSLARLRELFADPLLVRSGGALALTDRARALVPQLAEVLRGVQQITRGERFEPAEARGAVRIAAPDIVAYMLVPPLAKRLAAKAPELDLEIVRWQPDWRRLLEDGEVDMTVGFPKGDEPRVYARNLFEQDFAVVLRKGHPALRKKWDAATYAALDHALVTITGRGAGQVDHALALDDRSRRVRVRIPYPLLAPMLAVDGDLAVTTVRWLALRLAEGGRVVVRRPPVPMAPVRVPIVWHERTQNDPRHAWIRRQVVEAAASIETSRLRW